MAEPDQLTFCGPLLRRAAGEAHLGLIDEARARATQALAILESLGNVILASWTQEILGFIELSVGNAAGAEAFTGPAIATMRRIGFREPCFLTIVPDGIEALVSLGRLDEAKEMLEWWEEVSQATDRAFGLSTSSRCRGLLLAALGDPAGALLALEEALREHERIPDQPFELGRTLLAMGEVCRRAKRKRAAREAFDAAARIFERLETPLWAEKARSGIARIGGRTAAPLSLSATEARVAELAAAGRTNREIASALFMTPRTVTWNLSKVYRKVGVRSRTELARRLGSEAPV
jgi:DNA-binding CsgD family transcriptional regulator